MNFESSRNDLARLLEYAVDEPNEIADVLLRRYGGMSGIAAADYGELAATDGVGESGALLLRLVAELSARSVTDRFKLGRVHSEAEIIEYFKAVFVPRTNETVYVMLLDGAGRVTFSEFMGEGTVNSTSILPRKLLELAVRHGAAGVIIAHNHPSGYARPSVEDIELTELLKRMFRDSGRQLVAHYIIAGNECASIDLDEKNV